MVLPKEHKFCVFIQIFLKRVFGGVSTYWHISCACGHQLPCVPVVARVPTIQATVPPPHHWGRRKPSRAASVANSCG